MRTCSRVQNGGRSCLVRRAAVQTLRSTTPVSLTHVVSVSRANPSRWPRHLAPVPRILLLLVIRPPPDVEILSKTPFLWPCRPGCGSSVEGLLTVHPGDGTATRPILCLRRFSLSYKIKTALLRLRSAIMAMTHPETLQIQPPQTKRPRQPAAARRDTPARQRTHTQVPHLQRLPLDDGKAPIKDIDSGAFMKIVESIGGSQRQILRHMVATPRIKKPLLPFIDTRYDGYRRLLVDDMLRQAVVRCRQLDAIGAEYAV